MSIREGYIYGGQNGQFDVKVSRSFHLSKSIQNGRAV